MYTICAETDKPVRCDMAEQYRKLRSEGIIGKPVKNFQRFDAAGQILFLAGFELAGKNGRRPPDLSKTALLVADRDGALEANATYFDNYLKNGGMGSPNEFVYTLPTSVSAELAICLGIKGQILYMSSTEPDLYDFALNQAGNIVGTGQHDHVLMFVSDNNRIRAAWITKQTGKPE